MSPDHIPWGAILLAIIKLLKVFGIIPGALAALTVRKLYQKWRQNKAIAGWPVAEARIQGGQVHREGPGRIWAELSYSYFVGEYRAGTYIRRFRRKEDADDFVRQVKDMRLQVRYDDANLDRSVILDRDIEMVALLDPLSR